MSTTTTQVYRVYIKATAQAIWDAITKPEWTERYAWGGRVEFDLRPGGAFTGYTSEAMRSMGAISVLAGLHPELEMRISPAWTASMMPGSRLMRVPWLNSAWSNPSSRISRSMARPSVWRWEFQQVEKEYMFAETRPRCIGYGSAASCQSGRWANRAQLTVSGRPLAHRHLLMNCSPETVSCARWATEWEAKAAFAPILALRTLDSHVRFG